MSASILPDFATLDVPWDRWSEPFWRAGERGELLLPRCTACGTFRWPAGAFCPACHAQPLDWVPPGQGRIYSFTILPVRPAAEGDAPAIRIPCLVVFDGAPGVRLVSVLADAAPDRVAIGAEVAVDWVAAANTVVPVFRLAAP